MVLKENGDVNMAKEFLNSANGELKNVAEEWAKQYVLTFSRCRWYERIHNLWQWQIIIVLDTRK